MESKGQVTMTGTPASISFPGDYYVPIVKEVDPTSNFSTFYVSADQSIDALSKYNSEIAKGITVVSLKNEIVGAYKALILNGSHETYVPITVLLGRILMNLQRINNDQFATMEVTNFVMNCLQQYVTASFQVDGFPTMLSQLKTMQIQQTKTSARTSSTSNSNKNSPRDEDMHSVVYLESYRVMRKYIPTDIFSLSLQSIIQQGLPRPLAERIWKTKILWLICMHPLDIAKVHIGDLRGKYISHGLDLLEMRAVWHILPDWSGRSDKAQWRRNFKEKLDSLALAEFNGTISAYDRRHAVYQGYADLSVYDPDQPLTQRFLEGGEYNTNTRTNAILYNDFLSPSLSLSIPPSMGTSGSGVGGDGGTSNIGGSATRSRTSSDIGSLIHSPTDYSSKSFAAFLLRLDHNDDDDDDDGNENDKDKYNDDKNESSDPNSIHFEELKEENLHTTATITTSSYSSKETAIVGVAEPSSPVRNLHTNDYMYSPSPSHKYNRDSTGGGSACSVTPNTHSHYNTLQLKLKRLRESMQGPPRRPRLKIIPPSATTTTTAKSHSYDSESQKHSLTLLRDADGNMYSNIDDDVIVALNSSQVEERASLETCLIGYRGGSGDGDGSDSVENINDITINRQKYPHQRYNRNCDIFMSDFVDSAANTPVAYRERPQPHRHSFDYIHEDKRRNNNDDDDEVIDNSNKIAKDLTSSSSSSSSSSASSSSHTKRKDVNTEDDEMMNENDGNSSSDSDSHTWKSVASASRNSRGSKLSATSEMQIGLQVSKNDDANTSHTAIIALKEKEVLNKKNIHHHGHDDYKNDISSSSPSSLPMDTSIEIKNDAMHELLLYNYYFNEKLEQQQKSSSSSSSPRGQGHHSSSKKSAAGRAREGSIDYISTSHDSHTNTTTTGVSTTTITNTANNNNNNHTNNNNYHNNNNNSNNDSNNNEIKSPFSAITDVPDAPQYPPPPPPPPTSAPISPMRSGGSSSYHSCSSTDHALSAMPASSPPVTPVHSHNSHNGINNSANNHHHHHNNKSINNIVLSSPISPISPGHNQHHHHQYHNNTNDNSHLSSPSLSSSLPPSVNPSPTHSPVTKPNSHCSSGTGGEFKRNDSRSLLNASNHSSHPNSSPNHTNTSNTTSNNSNSNNNHHNSYSLSHLAYRVVIQSADNLSPTGRKHSPYPSAYCTLYLVNSQGKSLVSSYNNSDCQTRVVKSTQSPVWNKEFVLRLTGAYTGPPPAGVMLEVKDSSSGIFGHKHLGQTVVPIDCFLPDTEAQFCLPLESINSKASNAALDSLGEIRVLTELVQVNSPRMFSLQTPRSSTDGIVNGGHYHSNNSVLSGSSHSGGSGGMGVGVDASSVIDNSRMSSGNKYDGNRSNNNSSIFDVDMNDTMRSTNRNNTNGINKSGIAAPYDNQKNRLFGTPISPYSSSHSLSLLTTPIKRTQSEEDLFIENEVNNFIIPYDLSPTARVSGSGGSGTGFGDSSHNNCNNRNDVFLVKDILHTNILTSGSETLAVDVHGNRRRIFSTDDSGNGNNANSQQIVENDDVYDDDNSSNNNMNKRHTSTTVTTREDRASSSIHSNHSTYDQPTKLKIIDVFNLHLPMYNDNDEKGDTKATATTATTTTAAICKTNSNGVQKIKKLYEADEIAYTSDEASLLLLQYCERLATQEDDQFVSEPLELLMLLIDCFGADVNIISQSNHHNSCDSSGNNNNNNNNKNNMNGENGHSSGGGMTALHHLFNQPLLGRYLVVRGADIFMRNEYGESVLELCMEYDCDWLVPVFESTGAEQHMLLLQRQHRHKEIDSDDSEEDRDDDDDDNNNNNKRRTIQNPCNDYIKVLLFNGNYLDKIKGMVSRGDVVITVKQANSWLQEMTENGVFQNMVMNAVETFEFLDNLSTSFASSSSSSSRNVG